jgi:predicted sulfurtransferase
MTFTDQQLKDWAAYEEVRLSGECNMFDRRAAVAAGLSQDEHLFCMANYDALKKAYEAKEAL